MTLITLYRRLDLAAACNCATLCQFVINFVTFQTLDYYLSIIVKCLESTHDTRERSSLCNDIFKRNIFDISY